MTTKRIKKGLTKKEIQQIITLGWEERRKLAKIRSEKNSKLVKKWKLDKKLPEQG